MVSGEKAGEKKNRNGVELESSASKKRKLPRSGGRSKKKSKNIVYADAAATTLRALITGLELKVLIITSVAVSTISMLSPFCIVNAKGLCPFQRVKQDNRPSFWCF